MKQLGLVLVACLAACEKASPPPPTTTERQPPGDASQVSADVEAAMTEFLAYSESVFVIMREHGKDCDEAARLLAPRATAFAELGPRMMKVKTSLQALPEQERTRVKQASDHAMEAFKARNPDTDAIEQIAKACDKSSPAFAEISPKVMFVKKK